MSLGSKGRAIDLLKYTSAPTRLNALELACTTLHVLRHASSNVGDLSGLARIPPFL